MTQIRTDMNMYKFTLVHKQMNKKQQQFFFMLIHIQFTNTLSSFLSDLV